MFRGFCLRHTFRGHDTLWWTNFLKTFFSFIFNSFLRVVNQYAINGMIPFYGGRVVSLNAKNKYDGCS